MPAISSSVAVTGAANASGSRAPGSRVASAAATRIAVLDAIACRSATTSAADDEPSSFDSLSQVRSCWSPSRRLASNAARVASSSLRRRCAASRSRFASCAHASRRGDGAIRRLTTIATPTGIATISHAYISPRVAASPNGTRPSWSSPKPTIIARIAPTGRSLLADVR